MPARRSNAALLLQKVNTQLHGERVPLKSQEEDELAAYLNTLTQRSQQVRDVDISTSSGADTKNSGSLIGRRSVSPALPTPASRFLKKKPQPDVAAAAGWAGTNDVTGKKNESRVVLAGSNKKDEIARTLGSHFVPSDQDSLTEFIQGLSTSELSARRPQNLVTKKQQKWRKRTSSSVSHSPSPVLESRPQSPLRRSRSPFGKLSQSASQDSDMVNSLASEMLDGRPGSDNSDHHFEINLMDVASLLPSLPSPRGQTKMEDTHSKNLSQKHKSSSVKVRSPSTDIVSLHQKQKPVPSRRSAPKKRESSSSLFDTLGVRMADELLNVDADDNRDEDVGSSEESEIKTQSLNEHQKILDMSESSIITDIDDEHKRASPAKQNSLKTNARPTRKTPDVSDVDSTDVSEYSDSFNSESSTRTLSVTRRSRGNKLRTHSTKIDSQRSRDHKVVMEEMLVDVSATDAKGATRRWNTTQTDIHVSGLYGLQYVDPAPVARHVVSADALEALTAYSPNMLALQEMMKVQLELVQNFVAIQQRIYQSCMEGLQYDYKYTTLEDTREFIRKHQKPRLTFKEALQLVEQDEAITT